jgi:hypothetical protein
VDLSWSDWGKHVQSFLNYAERDFFHSNGGSSKLPACRRYALGCGAALSFPCSISSTSSEGAIQFFAFTLYTDAWTPSALRSENNRKFSSTHLDFGPNTLIQQ